MSVVRRMGRSHSVTKARIIHNHGTDEEEIHEVDALIQGESGFFEVYAPIYGGDLVEVPDPRRGPDGVERLARKVKVNNMGPRSRHVAQVALVARHPHTWLPPARDTRTSPYAAWTQG